MLKILKFLKRIKIRAAIVFFAGVICGGLVWAFSIPVTGFREPFDAPPLYYIATIFVSGVIATLPGPRYWWLAVIGIYLGERFYGLIFMPELRDYFLFGLIMNIVIPTWLPSFFGALTVRYLLRRKIKEKTSQ